MRSILEELFYGNICPNTDCRSHDKETKQLMGYIADHHDNLLSTLGYLLDSNNYLAHLRKKFPTNKVKRILRKVQKTAVLAGYQLRRYFIAGQI